MNSRLDKAINDKTMSVISYSSNESTLSFEVLGSMKKNTYLVTFNDEFNCNCPDFQRHKQICKHIYLIYIKVFRILIPDTSSNKINSLQKALIMEANNAFWNRKKKISRSNSEDECTICFDKLGHSFYVCDTCLNGFHNHCINKLCQPVCPICRSDIVIEGDASESMFDT